MAYGNRNNIITDDADRGEDDRPEIQTQPCPRFAIASSIGMEFLEYVELLAQEKGLRPARPVVNEEDPGEAPDAASYFGLN